MDESTAKALFGGKGKLNCLQAVLNAFQPVFKTTDAEIVAFKDAGGGKVEGGECGEYYAAKILLHDGESLLHFREEFGAGAGSLLCKDILKLKRLPCPECVALAAGRVKRHLKRRSSGSPTSAAPASNV